MTSSTMRGPTAARFLHATNAHSHSLLAIAAGISLLCGCNRSNETAQTSLPQQPPPANQEPIFLSDLPERDVVVGLGDFGKNGECGYVGRKIMVDGRFASKGLSTHCKEGESVGVTYDVPAGITRFVAAVAIIDDVTSQVDGLKTSGSPITFRVRGHHQDILWESPTSVREVRQVIPCDVSIRGQKSIRLEASCEGSANWCCAVWLNPFLSQSPDGPMQPLEPWLGTQAAVSK